MYIYDLENYKIISKYVIDSFFIQNLEAWLKSINTTSNKHNHLNLSTREQWWIVSVQMVSKLIFIF